MFNAIKNSNDVRNEKSMLHNNVLLKKKMQWLYTETTLLVENKPNVNSAYIWVLWLHMISIILKVLIRSFWNVYSKYILVIKKKIHPNKAIFPRMKST